MDEMMDFPTILLGKMDTMLDFGRENGVWTWQNWWIFGELPRNWVTKYVPRDRQVVRLALINKKGNLRDWRNECHEELTDQNPPIGHVTRSCLHCDGPAHS
jgi:hypothetical protein